MAKKESIKQFYQNRGQAQSISDEVKARQFNVYERDGSSYGIATSFQLRDPSVQLSPSGSFSIILYVN